MSQNNILILGGTGKTGRRIVERLQARNLSVRVGSRSAELPFDWNNRDTWAAVLAGMDSVYISYQPDLAVPSAADDMRVLSELAAEAGVKRLVLLSGRGEEEAQNCEQIVQASGLEWTILRASWFSQNFHESFLLEPVLAGVIALPVGDVLEPFIDAEDIADVAVAALTEDSHNGRLYELTGPRLMTFAEASAEIAGASGRDVQFVSIPREVFNDGMREVGLPEDYIGLVDYLFTTVLDGRNASLADGVQRALGRAPRDFAEYARETAATGVWNG